MPRATRFFVLVVVTLCLAASAAGDITEEETGIPFPDSVRVDGKELSVSGAGVREKAWFDVYAAALYVDAAALKGAMSKYAGRDTGALRSDATFYNDLVYADVTKALVIRMAREVDAGTMRDAFEEGLEPHMTVDARAKALVAEVNDTLQKGDEVRLEWLTGGRVRMVFRGRIGTTYKHPQLAASLLKIYLGTAPVSDDIKEKAVERIPEMLR
jgi:hypothetical protein